MRIPHRVVCIVIWCSWLKRYFHRREYNTIKWKCADEQKMKSTILHISELDKMENRWINEMQNYCLTAKQPLCHPLSHWSTVLSHKIKYKYVFIAFTRITLRAIFLERKKATYTYPTQTHRHFVLIHTDCVWNSKLTENVNACTANKDCSIMLNDEKMCKYLHDKAEQKVKKKFDAEVFHLHASLPLNRSTLFESWMCNCAEPSLQPPFKCFS